MNQVLTTQKGLNQLFNTGLVEDGITGIKTKQAINNSIVKIKELFKDKGYSYNEEGINIMAFRLGDTITDYTTDLFVVTNKSTLIIVPCSTKAGKYWIQNPITYGGITGTAILLEGQYKQCWQFVTATNWQTLWLQTPYFNQIKPVKIYRDANRDFKVDRDVPIQEGLFGINIHTAGLNYLVWNWSAGCIVIPRMYWLDLLIYFKPFEIYDFTLFKM